MGNTESTGLKMCSGNSLYTYANRNSLKEEMNIQSRVGYVKQAKSVPGPQYRQAMKLLPTSCQQQVSQQQMGQRQRQQQQDIPDKESQRLQIEVVEPKQQAQQEAPAKRPTFNVYVECIKDQIAEELPLPALEESATEDLEKEMKEKKMNCFTGLFGNVIVHENGLVLYTDINGEKYCEDFDAGQITKCFPLGIRGGNMSKSIWFNDVVERDSCFDAMTLEYNSVWTAKLKDISAPPSYDEVISSPERYEVPEYDSETVSAQTMSSPVAGFAASSLSYQLMDVTESETEEESDNPDDHIKVFEGLDGMQVIVHEDNLVLFTDINGDKHCQNYNPHHLRKVFPLGISGGGLPKSIWFEEAQERDLCFALMQWNMDEVDEAEIVEPPVQEFMGLYGDVTLKHNGEIEYTSFTGEPVKTTFEPDTLQPTFPLGISFGGLPKTIWFDNSENRQKALEAMRKM